MKSFLIEGVTYEIPEFTYDREEDPIFVITEGRFSETRFAIENLRMDEQDEGLLHYDCSWSDNVQKEDEQDFANTVNNIILYILHEQINRKQEQKNEELADKLTELIVKTHREQIKGFNMNYPHPFQQVQDFLVAFDQTVDKDNDHQRVLYAKLVSEEFAEFLQAYFEKDNLEQLDAVCDLVWVLTGYALSRGWDIYGAFDEVARSNMSKLDPETGKPIKREDGKVLKGANYFPPDLHKYLNKE